MKKRFSHKKWLENNPDYYNTYYKKHQKEIKANQQKYKKSEKGKKALKRTECNPKRKEYKRKWMREYRKRKKDINK